MSGSVYLIPVLVENGGGAPRVGADFQVLRDALGGQPVETSMSGSYWLQGRPLVTVDSSLPTCGIYVNRDDALTSSPLVVLGLICGHESGCTSVQLSNNGVAWTAPIGYTTIAAWTLASTDGTRSVFARFQNGLGNWSGVCSDVIVLDTTAPRATISPTGGTYFSTQSVALTSNEPATIKYSTDGSDPTTSPTAVVYAGPVPIANDVTLKAFARDIGGNAGSVVSETYEICTGSPLGLSGYVRDATRDNKPMPLVVVTLNTGQTASTDTNGFYSFGGLPRGWYSIESATAPLPGYVTYQSTHKLCKVSLTHDIVLTKDGTVFGTDTSAGYSADGVNTSTGNYAHKVIDLALPGRGPSFVFERSYNSQDRTNGPLGYGWTWHYNISLTDGPDGEVVLRWGDGKIEVWGPDGSGGYKPMYGVFSTLIKNQDTTLTLRRKDLVEYRFDLSRKLSSVVDEFGNTISFGYSGSRLTTVTDTSGRTISLSYDASDRITNVLDPIGRGVSFTYDGAGNLVSATDTMGETTRYAYDANHQLLSLTDPKGNAVVTNVYDESRRVVSSQRDAMGGETRYVYDATTRTTTITDALGNTSFHQFDDRLRLVRETDPRGYSVLRAYDERGNVASTTDRGGNVTTFAYDEKGNVLTKTEPLGRVTSATYDEKSNPLTKTDARGHAKVFQYDPATSNLVAAFDCGAVPVADCPTDPTVRRSTHAYDPETGQPLTVTEADGQPLLQRTTTYQYDVFGNRVAVIDAMGGTSTHTYDGVGRKLTEAHPLGRATAYEYDAADRLIAVTDALGGQARYEYDANGNKEGHVDARGNWTFFAYDAKDRLVRTTDPMGYEESYGYDALDRRVRVTNARGAVSTVVHDAVGNVLRQTDALGGSVTHEYDANGNRVATVDARGFRTEFTYDALNRLVTTKDPLGNVSTTEYDLNGNRTRVTDPLGKSTTFTYDAFDRLLTTSDHLGNTTTNTYDLLGRLVKVRDARGNETNFEYDALDRLVKVTDAAGSVVTATSDALGNRTGLTDSRGGTTTYAYDVLNRRTSETDPLGSASIMTYDAVGNIKTFVDSEGTRTYAYDNSNRTTDITFPDSTTASYSYDASGNRTRTIDSSGTMTLTYDLLDRLTGVTDVFGMTVGYTYDPNGNRTSTRYPGNRSVFYRFDALGRIVAVEDWGGVTTTYAYDDAGRLSNQITGNGATVTYAYDDADRLLGKEDRAAGGALIASYSFTLDPNGNRVGMNSTQPLTAGADLLDSSFAHNAGNQVTSNGATSFTYDGKGNRKTATDGPVTTQYAYDFQNRLTRISGGGSLYEYRYSSDGKRLASARDGSEMRYLLDLNGEMERVLAEVLPSGVVKRYYVYGDGLLYSIDGTTGQRLFYHFDPIGSTVALTDQAGTVVGSYAYLPFGEPAGETGGYDNPFTFVGKAGVMREANGLYFMRARYFDPGSRAFLSRDEVRGALTDTQSISRYPYARSNPIVFDDADGRCPGLINPSGIVGWAAAILNALGVGPNISLPGELETQLGGVTTVTLSARPQGPDSLVLTPEVHIDGPVSFVEGPLEERGTKPVNQTQLTGEGGSLPDSPQPARVERAYLSVAGFATRYINKDLKLLLDPDFLDRQTLSVVEMGIAQQVATLSQNVYSYRVGSRKSKARAKDRRARDVAAGSAALYAQLTSALSKHEVIVRDLALLPAGSTGGIAGAGVYAGR